MIEKKSTNYSLFARFISLTFLVFISLIFCVGWQIESVRKKLLNENIVESAYSISHNLIHEFEYTEDKMRFLATIISGKEGVMSSLEIQKLLQLFSSDSKIYTVPLNQIGWADSNHHIKVNSFSALDDPADISHRSYIKDILNQAFVLHFSKNDRGSLSNRMIAPAAMGIRDKNGQYLGCLVTGLVIEEFISKMNKEVKNHHQDMYYAVFSVLEDNIIIHSPNFSISDHLQLKNNIESFINNNNDEQLYSTVDENYVISKISHFPFIVVIGINPTVIQYKDFFYGLLSYKFELLFLLVIIFGLIYLFYQSILNPFLNLSKAAVSISNGNIDTIIPRIHSKEGAAVADALEKIKFSFKVEKDLVQEIYTSHNKLSITNLRLENKVAERTNALEQSLSDKTSFMNGLTHEIRSPLQGVTAITEVLINDWSDLPEAKKLDFIHQIAYSTKRLLSLIVNLLDLSKLSNSNKMSLDLTTFDLAELTTKIIQEAKALYLHKKPITINFVNSKPVRILADKDRIDQVVHNLLINAIKFSPKNGYISATIMPTTIVIKDGYEYEAIHFALSDQGIGIPESELTSIFAPFSQGEMIKNQPGSVGLGLTICHEIIRAHHGKIWADNNKDGGATFNFIIPIAQSFEQEIGMPSAIDLHDGQPNILIIDDEEICLTSMELLLHDSKYNLIKTSSGQMGLKYIQDHYESVSVILLDLMMPDMYGLNVLSEIKNNSKLSNIPVILQTGSSDEEEIIKAFDKGIFCFIRKPYKKQVLLNKIEKALKFYNVNK